VARFLRLALTLVLLARPATAAEPFVAAALGGKLKYAADARGDRCPDFSFAGYDNGRAPPAVSVKVTVAPGKGDSTARIQAAIDHVASLAADKAGFRGAVLLLAGRHEVAGQLRLHTGGVVLRGQGNGDTGTVVVATGTDRRTLIQVRGKSDAVVGNATTIADEYVPVGANSFNVKTAAGLKGGDTVFVDHPSTKGWIAAVGMNQFPTDDKGSWQDWKPGTLDVRFDRTVTKVDGDTITLDAPLTQAFDAKLAVGTVRKYTWAGRIERVGVESLRCESAFDNANPKDEQHAWDAIGLEHVRHAWVRNVSFRHFAGSAVHVGDTASQVTVEECDSAEPVSELGGMRRHTFLTSGQRVLFRRCKADHGRHDFAVGHLGGGPTAFVRCEAKNAHQFSGPIGSWATGVLFDCVKIDGGGLSLTNRETDGHGVGWAAANCVLWQCVAPVVTCRTPPTARNHAIACWGQFVGNGTWAMMNEFAKPESLFEQQLTERLGKVEAAAIPTQIPADAVSADSLPKPLPPPAVTRKPIALRNGVLAYEDSLAVGGRVGCAWWRGVTLPARATEVGYGVTRFVPGKTGPGFTDDLTELADSMTANHQLVLEHHWGLWYDRRRDDHQMVRRADAEVWAPFYEQPWARTGTGAAWDGLSKYDLTQFNPWYFARLKQFADQADRRGRVFVQHMYFQHNVLEAGAHWADFPWRPANCVNDTGFPEPPKYAGDKRVFVADTFYDVTHPVRKELHRAYTRKCLDTLGGNTNVLFSLGEEFTGPRHFVEFWLDVVAEWRKETGRAVKVSLGATKDVQDAILADAKRAAGVNVIDLKYWWYTADGRVYDPKGGENLAPRQHLREWKGGKTRSAESVAKGVREYRTKFPEKAVTVSLDGEYGWAVLAAGGSLPNLAASADGKLLAAVTRMQPFESKALTSHQFALAEPGKNYLVYSADGGAIALDLPAGEYAAHWIDTKSGKPAADATPVRGGQVVTLKPPGTGPAVVWVVRDSN
jgi:hypothetical protein